MALVHVQDSRANTLDERQKFMGQKLLQPAGPKSPGEESDDVGTTAWRDRLLPWTQAGDSIANWATHDAPPKPSDNPRFCDTCLAIFEDGSFDTWANVVDLGKLNPGDPDCSDPEFRRWRPLHASAADVHDGARKGCIICMHLLEQQPNGDAGSLYHMSDTYALISVAILRIDEAFFFDPHTSRGPIYRRWVAADEGACFNLEGPEESIEPLLHLHESSLSQPIGSESSLLLARHWFEKCREQHGCRKISRPLWYPSRLLCIEADYVRLLETRFHDLYQPYATLSHCWGQDSFPVLEPSTMDSLKAGRLRSEFLPTFRECFDTLEYLGMSLIWIDSYCILQGTSIQAIRDWACESALMQNVYINSAITITAAFAASPQDGCFNRARRDRKLPGWQVHWRATRSEPRKWWRVSPCSLQLKNLEREHLFSRAWVLQERLLSSRLLHFGTEQMFWQCSEVFLKGYVTELELGAAWMREIPRIQPDMLWRSRTPWVWDRDDDDGLRSEWTMILEAYTSAKLTNPHKDKLIAIDGILSYLTAFRKTWYTCGMFWRDLPEALCWEQAEVAPSGRAPQYRAPSWSWASVDGTIFMPFLRVSAGSLRLTCVLNTMTWTQDDIPKTALLCVGRVLPLLPPHGDQVITNPKAYWIYFFYGQWVKVIFDDETEELTSAHRTLYYFPIVSLEDSNYRFKSPDGFSRMQRRNHNALLLVKNSDGTFSRVAKTTHDQNAVQCPLSPLLAAIQAQPAQLVILV